MAHPFTVTSAQKTDSVLSGNIYVHYEIHGSGQPIYLLSGGPGLPPHYLNPIINELSKNNQCVLVHQRGTGQTPFVVEENGDYINKLCDDIHVIKEKLQHKQIIILGHSWGGMLAMHMATRYPTDIKKLILVSSGGYNVKFLSYFNQNIFSRLSADEQRIVSSLGEFSDKLDQHPDRAVLKSELDLFKAAYINILLNGYVFDKNNSEKFVLKPGEVNFESSSVIMGSLAASHWDLKEELSKLDISTLIIQGRQDPIDLETALKNQEALRNSELKIFEACGHLPWLEQPKQFYDAVQFFLTD